MATISNCRLIIAVLTLYALVKQGTTDIDVKTCSDSKEGLKCTVDEIDPPRLQVALVADRSSGEMLNFSIRAAGMAKDIMKEFPDTEFALTTFADYSRYQGRNPQYNSKLKNENDTERCYNLVQPFTPNHNLIQQKLEGVELILSWNLENQNGAMYFTSCDPNLNWVKGGADKNGRAVRKVLILLTNDYLRPLGSGTGPDLVCGVDQISCLKFKGPTDETVKNSLKERDFSVFGIYFPNNDPNDPPIYKGQKTGNLINDYKEYFGQKKITYQGIKDTTRNEDNAKMFVKFVRDTNKDFVYPCEDPMPYNILGL